MFTAVRPGRGSPFQLPVALSNQPPTNLVAHQSVKRASSRLVE